MISSKNILVVIHAWCELNTPNISVILFMVIKMCWRFLLPPPTAPSMKWSVPYYSTNRTVSPTVIVAIQRNLKSTHTRLPLYAETVLHDVLLKGRYTNKATELAGGNKPYGGFIVTLICHIFWGINLLMPSFINNVTNGYHLLAIYWNMLQ